MDLMSHVLLIPVDGEIVLPVTLVREPNLEKLVVRSLVIEQRLNGAVVQTKKSLPPAPMTHSP